MSNTPEPVGQAFGLREPCGPQSPLLTGESGKRIVFNAELDKIMERRQVAGVNPVDSRVKSNPESKKTVVDEAKAKAGVKSSLVGLALSGGGIRSGAFSLGVLETLRKTGLMKFVDYLSTVSGGGYAGAYWSTASMAQGGRVSIESKPDGRFSARMLSFAHTGNYLAKTAKFFNRYLPGLVVILTMCLSGLIAGASGLAFLFRELDQPYLRDAIAALGFDDDFLAAIFPATCAFLVWSLAWLASYWKYGHRLQASAAGVLIWPLAVCVLAAGGLLLGTGDIGLPFLQEQLLGSAEKTTESKNAPNLLWWLIYSVVGASLLPYLKFPALVRSGLNPQGAFDKYTFRIASAALLVGVPFVAFSLLAR